MTSAKAAPEVVGDWRRVGSGLVRGLQNQANGRCCGAQVNSRRTPGFSCNQRDCSAISSALRRRQARIGSQEPARSPEFQEPRSGEPLAPNPLVVIIYLISGAGWAARARKTAPRLWLWPRPAIHGRAHRGGARSAHSDPRSGRAYSAMRSSAISALICGGTVSSGCSLSSRWNAASARVVSPASTQQRAASAKALARSGYDSILAASS